MLMALPAGAGEVNAEALLRNGDVAAGLAAAASDADAQPDDIEVQELYVDAMLSMGQSSRLVRRYGARLETDPENPDLHYLVGRSEITPDTAVVSYERALRLDPDHARSHMGMAAVHFARGDLRDAALAYARAAKLDAALAEAWLGLVRVHAAAGNVDDAVTTARAGLAAVPTEPALYATLAALVPAEAEGLLETAVRLAPPDARVLSALAELRLRSGRSDGALAAATEALKVDPAHSSAMLTQMMATELSAGRLSQAAYEDLVAARALQSSDLQAAVERFDGLVNSHGGSAATWIARAQARQAQGDLAGAMQDLEHALGVDAHNVEAAGAYGLLLLSHGRAEEARAWLATAHQIRSWDMGLSIALARAYAATGELHQASEVLSAVLARDPYQVEALLTQAQVLSDGGEGDKAYAMMRDAVERVPDPRLGAALVLTAVAAKRYREAADLLDEVAALTGNAELTTKAEQLRAMALEQPQ